MVFKLVCVGPTWHKFESHMQLSTKFKGSPECGPSLSSQVTTSETHHPPPHCADVHSLVRKRSPSVSECHWVHFNLNGGIQ
jgi:hypothetical protein